MEEYLEHLLTEMVLETKTEIILGRHGSKHGEDLEYKTYYDVYKLTWTSYEKAVEGYILKNLSPTIDKIIKEK